MIDINPGPPLQVQPDNSKSTNLQMTARKHFGPLASLRNALFLAFVAASISLFWSPFVMLVELSMRRGHQYDQYSFTVVIPLLSMVLVYLERKRVFAKVEYNFGTSAILLLIGVAVDAVGHWLLGTIGVRGSLAITILGLVIFWAGGFILCFGCEAGRAGAFALFFLLLTVPLPSVLLTDPVAFVRGGSADIASFMFHLLGVPVLRDGFVFALPGLTIEIAKECSGIHSILALLIISLLAGHFTVLAGWKRVVLALIVFPIVCLTNGLRITALALLSAYVAPWILASSLHRDGGILFFLLGFFLLLLSVRFLRRREWTAQASSGEEK